MSWPTDRRIGNAGRGRPKGSPNKLSGDVKAMILAALDEVGGKTYLVEQAQKNPNGFLTLVGKVLPMQQEYGAGRALAAPSGSVNLIVNFVEPRREEPRIIAGEIIDVKAEETRVIEHSPDAARVSSE